MFHMFKAITNIKLICLILSLQGIKCSIDGKFPTNRQNGPKPKPADECNPLYWYPKHIPEHCNYNKKPPPTDPVPEIPFPIPVPIPVPAPPPILPPPVVPPRPLPPVPFAPVIVPQPIMPLPIPLPYGIPLAPTNPMVPVAGIPLPPQRVFPLQPYPPPYPASYPPPYPPPQPPPYGLPYPPPVAAPLPSPYASLYPSPYPMPTRVGRIGMVPGIPGLVSPDGGINIMPFSDAYSDMLENHKQKMLRRRLQKFLDQYERPPWKNRRKPRPKDHWQTNDIE